MTIAEIAYLAGIIDGEGSIMLIKVKSKQFPSPCISISSSNLELLEWIQCATSIGKIIKKKTIILQYIKIHIYIESYMIMQYS